MKPTARASARLSLIAGLLTALALSLSACGDEGSGSAAATGKSTAATAQSVERAEPPASANPCRAQVGGFLDSMNALRGKLEVGLSYEDYIATVGRVRAAYDRLPTARLELDCLIEAGTPGEKAFNEYIAAANVWGECLVEAGCGAASIEGRLQSEWRVASRFLTAARSR
jgi:hypothetical protein